jgi:hypothetical protein
VIAVRVGDEDTRLWCHKHAFHPPRPPMRHRLLSQTSGRCTFTCQRRKKHVSKASPLKSCRCRCHRRMGWFTWFFSDRTVDEVSHTPLYHSGRRRSRRHTYDGYRNNETGDTPGELYSRSINTVRKLMQASDRPAYVYPRRRSEGRPYTHEPWAHSAGMDFFISARMSPC